MICNHIDDPEQRQKKSENCRNSEGVKTVTVLLLANVQKQAKTKKNANIVDRQPTPA